MGDEIHARCERRELNPDPLRDRILSPARLPVPPRSRELEDNDSSAVESGNPFPGPFLKQLVAVRIVGRVGRLDSTSVW